MENFEGKELILSDKRKENQEKKGDFSPEKIIEEDGSTTFIIRGVFSKIDSLKSMVDKKTEHFAQERSMVESDYPDGFPPDYKKGAYSYKEMIPDCGSPSSIEMPADPKLTIGFVRHLKHIHNQVDSETQEAFRSKAEKFVDSLNISQDTAVYIVTSTLASYVATENGEVERFSRTDGTAKVIEEVLKERGIDFKYNRIEEGEFENDSTMSKLKSAIDEFPISSKSHYDEMDEKINVNIKADKSGQKIPYPELPVKNNAVFASFTDDPKELDKKTGIGEVSSATVARTLKGFESLDDYFLHGNNLPPNKKRAVVITAGHGQFGTDISEAFFVATDKAFPVLVAGNGGYFRINSDLDKDDRIIKEFIINDNNIKE
jgi:hypothetical protein